MNFPQKISFKDKGQKNAKLVATVVGNDIPTSIQVKGTNDITNIKVERLEVKNLLSSLTLNGSRGNDDHEGPDDGHNDDHNCDHNHNYEGDWESRNKYTTLKQTLIFIKNGVALQQADYDVNGNLIVPTPQATITNGSIVLNGNEVDLNWTSVTESLITQYNSERKLPNSTTWDAFHIDRPIGAGTQYSSVDVPTVTGTIEYRLRVLFNSTTTPEKILMSQSITVAPPPAVEQVVVDSFNVTPNPDNGKTVGLTWTTSVEKGLKSFRVERQIPGSADFVPVITVPAVGAGNPYSFNDNVTGISGTVLYRLVAMFTSGNESISSSQSVSTSPPTATVKNFSVGVVPGAADTIRTHWESDKEVFLDSYQITRTDAIGTVTNFSSAAKGPGSIYDFDDIPATSGTYTYKLTAVFANNGGTLDLLLQGSASV